MEFSDFVVSETSDKVIIIHPNCLHKSVDDRRTYKRKTSLLKVFTQGITDGRGGLKICDQSEFIDDGFAINERPEMLAEIDALVLHVEICFCVCSRCKNFQAIADDALIEQDFFKFLVCVPGYFFWVEIVENSQVSFLSSEDGDPAKARLGTIEDEFGEEGFAVKFRHTPDIIMIMHVEGVSATPRAADYFF